MDGVKRHEEHMRFLWRNSCFFLRSKDSIMVSEQTMLLSPIELTFFLGGFSYLLKNEITNNLYDYDSLIVWFCDRFVCVTLNVSSFLCLNIFQSTPILVQKFLNPIPRDVFFYSKFHILLFLLGSHRISVSYPVIRLSGLFFMCPAIRPDSMWYPAG